MCEYCQQIIEANAVLESTANVGDYVIRMTEIKNALLRAGAPPKIVDGVSFAIASWSVYLTEPFFMDGVDIAA